MQVKVPVAMYVKLRFRLRQESSGVAQEQGYSSMLLHYDP